MRIVIEVRTELADQGTKERRIEVEIDDRHAADLPLLAQHLFAAAEGPDMATEHAS